MRCDGSLEIEVLYPIRPAKAEISESGLRQRMTGFQFEAAIAFELHGALVPQIRFVLGGAGG